MREQPQGPLERDARHLLGQLTLEEKISLVSGGTPFWVGMLDLALNDASHRHSWPAGVLPRLELAGLRFVDGPRGVVLAGGATTFPVPMARGASWNPELEEQIGVAISREARTFGANWVAGVCINLLRHPAWGRAQETYGEDPLLLGEMGAALTEGVQQHVMACVKHYALNSMENARFSVDVDVDDDVLHEVYLPHFERVVKAGVASVMSAYNSVNGEWCGHHHHLLTEVLRGQWGFDGFVAVSYTHLTLPTKA